MHLYPDSVIYLCFATYSILSTIWAPDKWGAILFSQSLLAGALFYFVLRSRPHTLDLLLKLLILCGLVNGFFALIQTPRGSLVGLFYNRNPYAGFLAPLIFVSLYFLLERGSKAMRPAFVFLLFSLLVSESRGAIYSTFAALFLLFLYLVRKRRWEEFKDLLFLLLLGFGLSLAYTFTKSMFSLPQRGLVQEGLRSLRWPVFRTYPSLFLLSPLLGHGLNSFFYVKDKIEAPEMNILFEGQIHAHNLFFNILLELGTIGFLLFLIFIWSALKRRRRDFSFLLALPLLVYFLPNLFEYNFPAPAFQVLFLSLCAKFLEKERQAFSVPVLKWGLLYGALVFFVFFSLLPVSGTLLLGKGISLMSRGWSLAGFELVSYSNRLCWLCSHGAKSTADFLFEAWQASGKKEDPLLLSFIEEEYKRAIRLARSVDNYVTLSKFYYRTGRNARAEATLLEALAEYPYSARLRIEMGKFYLATGNYGRAIDTLCEVEHLYRENAPKSVHMLEMLQVLARAYKDSDDKENYERKEEEIRTLQREFGVK